MALSSSFVVWNSSRLRRVDAGAGPGNVTTHAPTERPALGVSQ
jgi:hypothetical protein